MRKIGRIAFAMLLLAGLASAQIPTSGNVFFGYSYYNAESLSTDRNSLNGWEASVEGKAIPWVGIVADFSRHYGSENIPTGEAACVIGGVCPPLHVDYNVQTFLFGPRVSMSVGKIRPFAEALFGGAHTSANDGGPSDTSFATALGGGLDYKIIRPLAWRFQGDYLQTRFFGTTQKNVRVSTGIVLRF